VAAVLFVGALVFAIISFTGKNSEADDKENAQKELASTKQELEQTQEELGTSTQAGRTLSELLTEAASAADTLKSCTDSGGTLREDFLSALNAVQGGGSINDRVDALNQQLNANRESCATSDQAYQDLLAALDEARS
jgi:chromosome segregation ATPase